MTGLKGQCQIGGGDQWQIFQPPPGWVTVITAELIALLIQGPLSLHGDSTYTLLPTSIEQLGQVDCLLLEAGPH